MTRKGRRKFPEPWYEVRNQFSLKELWYQQYVKTHPGEFGLTDLEGPFESGPDFRGTLNQKPVTIDIEKDYLSYVQHGHPIFDVLIVAVLDKPHPDIVKELSLVIVNLDPQTPSGPIP